jgi:predicted amidophosphoribosyltransferase
VAKCHNCGTDTELFYGGVPTCPKCAQPFDERLEADARKPISPEAAWRSLAEVNRNLTAAREAYRKAHAARLKAEDVAKHLSPGHPDGTQALRSANQQVALASERYDKALRDFIDFRPASRGTAG